MTVRLGDTAPDFVGPDTTSTTNDGRIHAIISCIRCHYPNAGLNPIDAWSRNLFKSPLKLYSTDPEVFRDLRQKYLKDLEGPLQWNREQFSRTLHQITGMKPAEYAEAFTRFWAGYDGFLGLERAAREMSTTEAVFRDALLGFLKANGYLDTVLGGFLRGQEIPRRQWLEVYAQAQEIVRVYGGVKQP